MEDRILGTTMPVLEINLAAGESLISERGEMAWSSPNLQMQTNMGGAGGFGGLMRRAMGGGGLMMTTFTAGGGPALVAFAAHLPGHIIPVDIAPGQGYMCQRHGFLCGSPGLSLSIGFQQSVGAGIWGGVGFMLQKVEGQGKAWFELSGEMVTYDLAAGQTLMVHPGHLALFQESVQLGVTMIRGVANRMFGGEGLFMLQVSGPGKIWLQSLPLPMLAADIEEYIPRGN